MAKNIHSPYELRLPPQKVHRLTSLWLHLGVGALALAGIFAILLVFARTPEVQDLLPWADFFHTALIVHVDLSVLVWMLAISGLMSHFISYPFFHGFAKAGVGVSMLGTVLLALSAFTGNADPLLNNYIPVLQNITFFIGLSLFFCGMIFSCGLSLFSLSQRAKAEFSLRAPITLGIHLNAITITFAFLAIMVAYQKVIVPDVFSVLDAQQFYELTFWAGGHILQFSYTFIMMLAWLFLAQELKFRQLPSTQFMSWLFVVHFLFVLISPLALRFTILSFEYKDFFTQQMRFGVGIAPGVVMLYLLAGFLQEKPSRASRPFYNTLLWSIILFTVGGFIGFLIRGSNVIIPAHYHGSIVGITLALMGFVYLVLQRLGYIHLRAKLAGIQPVIYGTGQLMHVLGFAISGGYGTLRKTPGAAQTTEGQAALGLMGFGGLLSLIGGLLFVVVVYEAILKGKGKVPLPLHPAKRRAKRKVR
jgi:cytochrome c oxidase subunit I